MAESKVHFLICLEYWYSRKYLRLSIQAYLRLSESLVNLRRTLNKQVILKIKVLTLLFQSKNRMSTKHRTRDKYAAIYDNLNRYLRNKLNHQCNLTVQIILLRKLKWSHQMLKLKHSKKELIKSWKWTISNTLPLDLWTLSFLTGRLRPVLQKSMPKNNGRMLEEKVSLLTLNSSILKELKF